ncbi:MAG TPA: nuclear transport factor 2 family protein [Steroidobacteraceae bacterium]|nr:nuclear transport factor 2 family protein [Steroidobacteraceae bacterium]
MTAEEELHALRRELQALRHEVGMHADIQAVRTLQFKYGYYMDKCLFPAIVDLFAEDAVLYFLNGIFRGRAGARRLYGGASGLNGPAYGLLFEHILAQDIVDVAPDRASAQGRFRCFLQGGVHESKQDAPPRIPAQFLEAGIYENEYVKEDGVWKIKVFNYRIVYQARFEDGWAHSPRAPLMVSLYERTFPEDPRGPDQLRDPPATWPQTFLLPFHYPHPVTGKPVTAEPARG